MCLISSEAPIYVDGTGIECYKVLVKWRDKDGYVSPTYMKRYNFGEVYDCLPEFCIYPHSRSSNNIWYGAGFHACQTVEGAKEYLQKMIENTDGRYLVGKDGLCKIEELIIVRCVVPVGAYYASGVESQYHIPGLVATSIKVEEIEERMTYVFNC